MDKPMSVLDKLFSIIKLINNSEKPLTCLEVSEKLGIHERTVLRYLSRLAKEKVVGIRVSNDKVCYDYTRHGSSEVTKVVKSAQSYEYYRL